MPVCQIAPWKILVVDDDRDIHALTGILFSDLELNGRGVQFMYADSVDSALHILDETGHCIALILLDMVMGERDAGMKVAEHVRKVNLNSKTRFIIRTTVQETQPTEATIKSLDIDYCVIKSALTVPNFREILKQALSHYDFLTTEGLTENEFINSLLHQLKTLNEEHLTPFGFKKIERIAESIEKYFHGILG